MLRKVTFSFKLTCMTFLELYCTSGKETGCISRDVCENYVQESFHVKAAIDCMLIQWCSLPRWRSADRQFTYNVTLRRVHVNIINMEQQQLLQILSVCVCVFVALVIQHAKYMRHIVLPSVACLAALYFSALFHKRRDFHDKKLLSIKYVSIFFVTFVCNIYDSKKNSARYYKCT
jgi:hypothetical protein